MSDIMTRVLRDALTASDHHLAVLREERDWALDGWAEADRCADASAALAVEFEAELAATRAEADYLDGAWHEARAELDVHRDRAVARLDELVLLREELRRVQGERDEALERLQFVGNSYHREAYRHTLARTKLARTRAERDLAREALLGAHEIIRDYRAAAGCATPDVEDVGEGEDGDPGDEHRVRGGA